MEPEDIPGYHWPADRRDPDPARRAAARAWTETLGRAGWAAPHWPRAHGGGGLGPWEQVALQEECMRAGVPLVGGIGLSMLGPTVIRHGRPEQLARHLPAILDGSVAWAQGFSEPGAGSDLAAVATVAERDGDDYIVRGQKVWISAAQYADWLCLLVRTDPAAARHRGLSFLLLPADAPGVTIRPIEDMSGAHPFNEVFLDGVRVPAAQRVGEEHGGWAVAMTMLDVERSGVLGVERLGLLLRDLLATAAAHRPRGAARAQVADRAVEVAVARQLALRTVSNEAAGTPLSHEASVNQLVRAELHQRLARTAMAVAGLWGNLWCAPPSATDARGATAAAAAQEYVRAVAQTVMSGTPEIQRTVIATRGLGLPRG